METLLTNNNATQTFSKLFAEIDFEYDYELQEYCAFFKKTTWYY